MKSVLEAREGKHKAKVTSAMKIFRKRQTQAGKEEKRSEKKRKQLKQEEVGHRI